MHSLSTERLGNHDGKFMHREEGGPRFPLPSTPVTQLEQQFGKMQVAGFTCLSPHCTRERNSVVGKSWLLGGNC